MTNFKEFGEEFIKLEKGYKDFALKLNIQLQEWEAKQKSYLKSYNSFSDGFVDMKKDVYTQLYDSNLTINNKFQVITDTYIDKFKKGEIELLSFKQNISVS